MYKYVILWEIIDEEGFQFVESQVCTNMEEVENCKYNLEMLNIDPSTIKVYSLQEINVD